MSSYEYTPGLKVSDKSAFDIPLTASVDNIAQASVSANEFLSAPRHYLRRRPSANSLVDESQIPGPSTAPTEADHASHEDDILKHEHTPSITDSTSRPGKWRVIFDDLWASNYGAFLIVISQIFGCIMTISTRLLETPGLHGKPMHPFQILFVRQTITVLLCAIYAFWFKSIPHFPLGPAGTVRWLLVSRGFFGFLGVFGLYFSLQYLPLSEATILTFLCPVGTCYTFSLLLPGETFTRRQQMAAALSLLGVVFIARPTWLFKDDPGTVSVHSPETIVATNGTMTSHQGVSEATPSQHLQAIGVAMIGVVGCIGAMTSIRGIGDRAHPLLSVNYFSVWCAIVSLAAMLLIPSVNFRLPGNLLEWALLLTISLCGFLTQWLITIGMAYGASTPSEKISGANADQDLEMQSWAEQAEASRPAVQPVINVPAPAAKNPNSSKASGSKAVSMFYLSLLFSLISDKVIFGITPVIWSWIGSGLILAGAIWVAAEGAKSEKVDSDGSDGIDDSSRLPPSKHTSSTVEEGVGLLRDVDDHDEEQEPDRSQTSNMISDSTTTVIH